MSFYFCIWKITFPWLIWEKLKKRNIKKIFRFRRNFHCFDCSFVSDVKWWTHASARVMNRRKKSALLLWKIDKHSIETSSRRCFCSIVSKRGTHLAHSFLMSKFSVNMWRTALFVMPTMSTRSRSFSRRSSNTILWTFFTISVLVTSFVQPLRCSQTKEPTSSELNLARLWYWFDCDLLMKVLYHITMTNFSHVYKFTESVHYW